MTKALPTTLWLATLNPGKVAEFEHLMQGAGVEIRPIGAAGMTLPTEGTLETGATLESNARLKAEAVRDATGGWAFADDSGLFVEALGGLPGVDTAHYGGPARLLEAMKEVPETQRQAEFRCTLALARPGMETLFFTGTVAGSIAMEAKGTGGFGYDPVFVAEGRQETTASIFEKEGLAVKDDDHRGRAAVSFKTYLLSLA